MLDPTVPVETGCRPAIHPRRRIVEAILCGERTAWAWRMMPHGFPPRVTVYWYFQRWAADRTTDRIHEALRAAVRDAAGRDPSASAGIVDSRSFKGSGILGPGARGCDAGNKPNRRKRHLVVDTRGRHPWSCRSPRRTPTEDCWFRTRRGDGQVGHLSDSSPGASNRHPDAASGSLERKNDRFPNNMLRKPKRSGARKPLIRSPRLHGAR